MTFAEQEQDEVDAHRLSMTVLMTPDMSNFRGNVHGGLILKLLDQVAYTCATRFAGCYAVTLSVDGVIFRQPVNIGELVTFSASVNYTGRTSMEVGIRVETENLVDRTTRHTNSCYFTMVAIGENGVPTPVPPLQLRSEVERRRWAAAEKRRELRKLMSQSQSQSESVA
jgi:acyl-CoA hydrolase